MNMGVADGLASLSDSDAEIVLLACWEGLNSKEIGRVVGLSPAAVRMRLSRAKRTLSTANDRQEQDR